MVTDRVMMGKNGLSLIANLYMYVNFEGGDQPVKPYSRIWVSIVRCLD